MASEEQYPGLSPGFHLHELMNAPACTHIHVNTRVSEYMGQFKFPLSELGSGVPPWFWLQIPALTSLIGGL